MSELHRYFGWLRWNLSQEEIQESWIKDRGVWFSALVLVGAIIGAGIVSCVAGLLGGWR